MNRGKDVTKKGFTLIEALMGLCLLGLISVTVLPIISSSFIRLRNHNTKIEMIYIGEMVVEKIKAFDIGDGFDASIYDTNISEIIDLFKSKDTVEIFVPKKKNSEEYSIKIIKKQKCDGLWILLVYVYHNNEGDNVSHVEYKAYLPEK